MNRDPQHETSQPSEDPSTNADAGHWRQSHRLAHRRAQRLPRRRHADDQKLAWRVQDILVGCGLSRADFSIAAGHVFHIPQVVSVVPGPPVGVNIRMLPGQMPDDFAAHVRRIAYNLDVAEVRVIPLGPSLIRLELVKKSDSAPASVSGSQD